MIICRTVEELLNGIRDSGLSPVALVPTMGALHMGHISLVRCAISQCPLVVVSIYVNPAQFNDKNDLKNYPRTFGADIKMLGNVLRESDIVFHPDDKEIYPAEDKRVFHFGNLDNVMEALQRPGHFNGVGQVVSRLFEIVRPDFAVFGLKDFQQLAVIRELVRQTGYKVRIMAHPIIREPDGLAMSSRNMLLGNNIRSKASIIYKTISAASGMISDHEIDEIKDFVNQTIEKEEGFNVEYFEIVDDKELIPAGSKKELNAKKHYFGCIAVKAGKIRLIDNIEFPLP